MSPEQARGQPVDRRTDIWAFGCCLYECLSGRSAFKGNTVTDTLTAVLDKDPDWSALSDGVPSGVRRLLRRSLAKDVRLRLQHIGDARLELEETETDSNERSAPRRRSFRDMPVLFGAVLIAVAAGVGSWLVDGERLRSPTHAVARLTLRLEGATAGDLTLPVATFYTPFALSPDGERLVFRARGGKRESQLFLRELVGVRAETASRYRGGDERRSFHPTAVGSASGERRIAFSEKSPSAGGSPTRNRADGRPAFRALGSERRESDSKQAFQTEDSGRSPPGRTQLKRNRRSGASRGREDFAASARIPGGSDLLVASSGSGGNLA